MALSPLAGDLAAEIRDYDWSDAPWRADRAGHNRTTDSNRVQQQLSPHETETVRFNVMLVAAQALGSRDRDFDPYEFAEAAGVDTRTPSGREQSGHIRYGLRQIDGRYCRPGTWDAPASA
jgi:hypothetical protein